MKATRDKTSSVDLGNGLRLEKHGDEAYLQFKTSSGQCEGARVQCMASHDGDIMGIWANEILAKHFTPITITLETEDEACTLWHLLNLSKREFDSSITPGKSSPRIFVKDAMWVNLNSVYDPRSSE